MYVCVCVYVYYIYTYIYIYVWIHIFVHAHCGQFCFFRPHVAAVVVTIVHAAAATKILRTGGPEDQMGPGTNAPSHEKIAGQLYELQLPFEVRRFRFQRYPLVNIEKQLKMVQNYVHNYM